ncbi:carboxylate--amine ligase [Acrocarpospora corrugata]|uniref:Carboxylate--amine ligase n=1 Tax=Acrocarpospora corrugata TaxID=35763 RepID=A0A5M3W988_9ACTN|nr:siderophore biosynthesis protein [Acrocarpospora corrugata]GES05637.1 carboxylate--amine ligase [Acrocarpospora corrugata]
MRLYLATLNPTDSVGSGFLPAADRLGWDVAILTDRPERYPGRETIGTDVRDTRALIDTIARHHPPDVVFTNSDHIQAETALAASYFDLPGKDWRACLTTKNKSLTRRRLALAGVESVRSVRLAPGDPPPTDWQGPVVIKPREGVASEDVILARNARELWTAATTVKARRPGETLVIEEYLEGPLFTLETLGDGREIRVLGGYRTTLGPLPHFVEERLDWEPDGPGRDHVLAALNALGVNLGACHTEYVLTATGPRIIEVNYRVIGDNCDFLLADLLEIPLFEWILRAHAGEPLGDLSEISPERIRGGSGLSAEDSESAREIAAGRGMHRESARGLAASGGMHGATVSLLADQTGTIIAAPPEQELVIGSARVWHHPIRALGDYVQLTHTNRDYLGLLRVIAPNPAAVDDAVRRFREEHRWVIS